MPVMSLRILYVNVSEPRPVHPYCVPKGNTSGGQPIKASQAVEQRAVRVHYAGEGKEQHACIQIKGMAIPFRVLAGDFRGDKRIFLSVCMSGSVFDKTMLEKSSMSKHLHLYGSTRFVVPRYQASTLRNASAFRTPAWYPRNFAQVSMTSEKSNPVISSIQLSWLL